MLSFSRILCSARLWFQVDGGGGGDELAICQNLGPFSGTLNMGGCQNDGPFLDPYYNTAPNIEGTPKRDHNFDNHPYDVEASSQKGAIV